MIEGKTRGAGDDQALRALGLIGQAHQATVPAGAGAAELVRALAQVVDPADVAAPSDAEAADLALELLAQQPGFAARIEAMRSGPQTRSLGVGVVEGALLIAGLLVALQTHFEYARDKDGRWSVTIKKKPTSDALLKPLIKKLTDLLGL